MNKEQILLVDDDAVILNQTRYLLDRQGYETTALNNGENALQALERRPFDLVLTDLVMAPVDGFEVLKSAKNIYHQLPVVVLSGFGDISVAVEALRLGVDDFILKPFEPEELLNRIETCFERKKRRQDQSFRHQQLSMCMRCKKIKTNASPSKSAEWKSIEKFIYDELDFKPSHTYCSGCSEIYFSL